MKKTIAILLILVIGMVGVFAAVDAQLDLKLAVVPITQIYVSNATDVEPETYEEFNNLVTGATVNTTEIDLTTDEQLVGTLHYMTNAGTGTSVMVSATLLKGPNHGTAQEPIHNTIGYSVRVGAETGSTALTVAATAGATSDKEIPLTGEIGKLTISNHAINVTLVETDYLNAAAEEYTASIYFNFKTN